MRLLSELDPGAMRRMRRLTAMWLAAMGLAACASDGPATRGSGAAWTGDFSVGSDLEGRLPPADEVALGRAVAEALTDAPPPDDAPDNLRANWSGPSATGWIAPGGYVLGDVSGSGPTRPKMPKDLFIDVALETELGLHALTKNANIRRGPSTEFPVLETLRSGDAVYAVGRVRGENWMMIEKDGRIRGYIYEPLLRRNPGAELELVGGPTLRPVACREYEQGIVIGAEVDRWRGVACRRSGAWTPEPPASNAPEYLFQ